MTARSALPLAFFLCAALAHGQRLSHPLLSSAGDVPAAPRQALAAIDTVRILAAMVQFQSDTDTRTTGTGRFVLTAPTDSSLDAPPRNRAYFEQHLTFLANYYRKASKGKLTVTFTVIDSVFTLPALMAAYSPPKGGSDSALANLARDTWTQVDASGRVPDFGAFSCFVLFHAGVGRDIDLVGTLGYDPAPLDIPSLYLGLNAFRRHYGPVYAGIPVQGGARHITNTLIMPETESRMLPGVTGDVPLELGINGLLCASLGNHLGLPDLFNTTDGRSGIGRFGLMDGQAIFSFSGAFPPEPTAWEKYWLGWITPIDLPRGTTTVSVPAASLVDTVYRIPVSADEYFLIENRNRDVGRDGQTVTSVYNGVQRVQRFSRDTSVFSAGSIAALAGVVTDVDEPDWSLPGGVDDAGNWYDGGILLWHVDEAVIRKGMAGNTVNADPDHRGVDVEEADGSQDIGRRYDGFFSPGAGSEEGTVFDFWYQGNRAPIYRNVFSGTTFPDSRTSAGAQSHIVVRDFSARGLRMTVTIDRGDATVSTIGTFPRTLGERVDPHALLAASFGTAVPSLIAVTTGEPTSHPGVTPSPPGPSRIFAWSPDGTSPIPGIGAQAPCYTLPDNRVVLGSLVAVDLDRNGQTELLFAERRRSGGGGIRALMGKDTTPADGQADLFFATPLTRDSSVAVCVTDSLIAVADRTGLVYFLTRSGVFLDSTSALPAGEAVVGLSGLPDGPRAFIVAGSSGTVAVVSAVGASGNRAAPVVVNLGAPLAGPVVSAKFQTPAGVALRFAVTSTDGRLFLLDPALRAATGFPVSLASPVSGSPAFADVDGDGVRDVIVTAGGKLHALNWAGVSLDFFPLAAPGNDTFTGNPVIGDADGDGTADVICGTGSGAVVAMTRRGETVRGFPLAAGIGVGTPLVASSGDSILVAAPVSEGGAIAGWVTGRSATPTLAAFPWTQERHDAARTGFDPSTPVPPSTSREFFPSERAYNWPNPVYDGQTFIRYFVNESAAVRIRIFDLAGALVAELAAHGVAGVDNEVAWNVQDVQSGVYLARIEARGAATTAHAIVKIAVVK